jgi:hypothetical protein
MIYYIIICLITIAEQPDTRRGQSPNIANVPLTTVERCPLWSALTVVHTRLSLAELSVTLGLRTCFFKAERDLKVEAHKDATFAQDSKLHTSIAVFIGGAMVFATKVCNEIPIGEQIGDTRPAA